ELDEAAVATAAQPLIDKGAVLALYIGDGTVEDGYDWLVEQDLMRGENFEDNLIGILVGFESREIEIVYGANFERAIAPRAESIISGNIGPNLRENQHTLAMVSALGALNGIVQAPDTQDIATATGDSEDFAVPEATPTQTVGIVPPEYDYEDDS